jgi:type III secretion protein V
MVRSASEADIASKVLLSENPIILELGEGLAPLVAGSGGSNPLLDRMFPFMRDGLFYELGVQYPGLHLRIGSDIPPSCARVLINDVPESHMEVRPDSVMVSESVSALAKLGITRVPAVNPTTGWENAWIPADSEGAARELGLTTWDTHGFLILLLSSILRKKAADFYRY